MVGRKTTIKKNIFLSFSVADDLASNPSPNAGLLLTNHNHNHNHNLSSAAVSKAASTVQHLSDRPLPAVAQANLTTTTTPSAATVAPAMLLVQVRHFGIF